ncbi:putative transposase [Nephila pilipes]|uniref:Putative transposase n=1 Tax=Nephila pilipes TaxID=299642 RepID=A0A8X6Q7R8_NEPPI|nr:putative transposase [Nephila pilipes]
MVYLVFLSTHLETKTRWVPRRLIAANKTKRSDISQRLLDCFKWEGDTFLSRIVVANETWIHHYEHESIRRSVERKHSRSQGMKKFKATQAAEKVMLSLFWDDKDPILDDQLDRGTSVNGARYSDLLANKLKPAIVARPRSLKFPHFKLLKESLRGCRFASGMNDWDAVQKWLYDQPKTFEQKGLRKLVARWIKCIAQGGDKNKIEKNVSLLNKVVERKVDMIPNFRGHASIEVNEEREDDLSEFKQICLISCF